VKLGQVARDDPGSDVTVRRQHRMGKGQCSLGGFIPEDVLSQIKNAADIIQIIGQYVTIKKAGRSFKALCPFHNEKTPSFVIHPDRQFFHCFGCGKSGDVFSFVSELERVEFPEAVRIVADSVGITIPETRGGGDGRPDGQSRERKTRLYEVHTWAERFFAAELAKGGVALDYLVGRKFTDETIKAWGLGYAPESWDALGTAAVRAGYSAKELLAAGLVVEREGGRGGYDRFRNRVMFPIRDVQGRTIGFGARALVDGEVKYLNSPETPLFSKSRCLYGLDAAREGVRASRRVMITEGYTDALMCHQCGLPWAVATLGTALTREHAQLLRRYADQVVLVFDADQAGEAAVDRSLEVFANSDLDVRVGHVDSGADPCEFLISDGPEAFLERLDSARELFAVKMDLACKKHDLDTSAGRAQAIDEVLTSVALVANVARADLWVQAVSRRMGVDLEALRRRVRTLQRPNRRHDTPDTEVSEILPVDPVEMGVLRAVLARGELMPSVLSRAALDDFRDPRIRRILEQCITLYDREGEIEPSALSATLQDRELAQLVADIALRAEEQGSDWERWLQDCLDRMEERTRKTELHRLKQQVAGASGTFDRDALAALTKHHKRRAGSQNQTGQS